MDAVRRALQVALVHGGLKRAQARLEDVIPSHGVADQVEGTARLSADVLIEMAHEVSRRSAARAFSELLAPLGLIVSEEAGEPDAGSPLEALALLVSELGDVSKIVAGGVQPDERIDFAREIAEAEVALSKLKATVLG